MNKNFYVIIRYEKSIVYDFYTNDVFSAIVKLAALLADEFPHAIGEIEDLITGSIVYNCRKRPIC
jgi:hypothetical protein